MVRALLCQRLGNVLALLLHINHITVVSGWQRGIMIDAGSGGSRLHLFQWPDRVADPMHPQYPAITIPQEVFSVSVNPGISAFANNVSALEPYMHNLINQAKAKLMDVESEWSIIPIYLKATAGARDLYVDQRDVIFNELRRLLFGCPFRFDSEYWAKTIAGEEEGTFAWLSVNGVMGTYETLEEQASRWTWGILDMGGASTQIAFVPKDISIIQNYYELRFSYMSVHLYSHSYLEFGYRDANVRMLRGIMDRQYPTTGDLRYSFANDTGFFGEHNPVKHPCFPAGQKFQQPIHSPFAEKTRIIWVEGTGNFEKCQEEAQKLMHLNARCFVPGRSREFAIDDQKGQCAINGIYQPSIAADSQFVAMGQYAKIAVAMGLTLNVPSSVREFRDGARRLCQDIGNAPSFVEFSEDEEVAFSASSIPDPMSLSTSKCWKAVWFYTVLSDGLRFELDAKQLTFAKELNGQGTGWAGGAMAYEVNYYPWEQGFKGAGTADNKLTPSFAEIGNDTRFTSLHMGAAVFAGLVIGFLPQYTRRAMGCLRGQRLAGAPDYVRLTA